MLFTRQRETSKEGLGRVPDRGRVCKASDSRRAYGQGQARSLSHEEDLLLAGAQLDRGQQEAQEALQSFNRTVAAMLSGHQNASECWRGGQTGSRGLRRCRGAGAGLG